MERSKCKAPVNSNAVSRTLSPRNEIWGWERVGFVYLHHSFLGTFAVGDSSVALQSLNGDLPSGHIKAADSWDRS